MHILFTLIFISLPRYSVLQKRCPSSCECGPPTKMKCIRLNWNEQDIKNNTLFFLPNQLQNLDLSNNYITALDTNFIVMPLLKKLVLSENKIKIVDANAFSSIANLKTLDLSVNLIEVFPKDVFKPLKSLERLKLRKNLLITLQVITFSGLNQLNQLDLSENPWHCDCNLVSVKDWARNQSVTLQPIPKCRTPEPYLGISFKRLDLPCPVPWGLELTPSIKQVVFEGDTLALRCRSVGNAVRVTWFRGDKDVQQFSEIDVNERNLGEHGLVESWIRIENLTTEHSGDWVCREIDGMNHSASISVLVLSTSTKYCSSTITKDNKGILYWPKTIVGNNVELPCTGDGAVITRATALHTCNEFGNWISLNTSGCPYVSETTRILENFSRDSSPKSSTLEKARKLFNLSNEVSNLNDPDNIVYLARTIEVYASETEENLELAAVLADIILNVLSLPRSLFVAAQSRDQACSRLVKALEMIAQESPELQVHMLMLAIEQFNVISESFTGMSCIWRGISAKSKQFHCASNSLGALDVSNRDVVSAIELPSSLFAELDVGEHQLIITMFANGFLFPDLRNESHMEVTSSVVGANLVGLNSLLVNDSVTVMAKVRPGLAATPAWWDFSLNGGAGGWNSHDCLSLHLNRDLLVFKCSRLGYYGLLQDRTTPYLGFQSKWGYTAMYSGSCVLLVCLLAAIITYILCQNAVVMSRRIKHAVVNTWLSICVLCFIFTFGIFTTEDTKVCECIGLALHYFSLSTLLWMAVVGNHMYKRLSRGGIDRTPDDLPPGVPLHKPILGLYLVGWGIGLIVCGISGAVHLRDYAQPTFCFLGVGPALSAVLVPAAILVTLLCVFYFLSLCALRNGDVNGQLSEGTQGTENVDLELLEDGVAEHRSARSVLTDTEDIEDVEHSPVVQIKAHVIVLIFYLLLWCSAALAATSAVYPIIPWQEFVSTSSFCLFSFSLGAFIFYFYCVARSDIRARWGIWRKMVGKQRRCCRSRSVSDTHAILPLQPTLQAVISNGPSSLNSGVTGHSSSSHRTNAVTDLNNCGRIENVNTNSKPTNCVNLVDMHRQIYRSNNSMPTYHEVSGHDSADVFYNRRQSIIAKKFFKRQRRNKRNDLGLRRRGDGGGTSDGEVAQGGRSWRPSAESAVFLSSDMENTSENLSANLFGYGSKINNTNIHVGANSHRKDSISPKDPNILSEGDDDKGGGKLLLSRLVIGAEEDNTNPGGVSSVLDRVDEEAGSTADCRSVELQCSLGDSSDVPDCDDSFSHKVDNLPLQSDQSCHENLSSPPRYVTVLDPKYGVVKVTVSDYERQSDTLTLASPSELQDTTSAQGEVNDLKEETFPGTQRHSTDAECIGDDSFGKKIDHFHLHSDDSWADTETSPPYYVTVVDPKYGMVKVTMSDYHSQSDRLVLANPSELTCQPATCEVLQDNDDDSFVDRHSYVSRSSPTPADTLTDRSRVASPTSAEDNRSLHKNSSQSMLSATHSFIERNRPSQISYFPKHYVIRKKHRQRRSLPCSPESRTPNSGSFQRLSLPSSPESRVIDSISQSSHGRRLSPRLFLPPPPDLPVPDGPEDIEGGGEEQWTRPSPPTSPQDQTPIRRRTQRPRPLSDNLTPSQRSLTDSHNSPGHRTFSLKRQQSQTTVPEKKKETSV